MTPVRHAFLTFVFILFTIPTVAAAQSSPLPTGPFPAPIVNFVGRFYDAGQFNGVGIQLRMVKVLPALDRVYVAHGITLSYYKLSTLMDRLGQPLLQTTDGYAQLTPDWSVTLGLTTSWRFLSNAYIVDVDVDDRDLTYVATSAAGWGILDSRGQTLFQEAATPSETPLETRGITTLKLPSSYRTYVTRPTNGTNAYATDDPERPTLLEHMGNLEEGIERMSDGSVAIAEYIKLRIRNGDGTEQLIAAHPGLNFYQIAAAGNTIYALQIGTPPSTEATLTVFSRARSGAFIETAATVLNDRSANVAADNAYAATVAAAAPPAIPAVRVGTITNGRFVANDIGAYFPLGVFHAKPFAFNGKHFLIAAFKTGDVYELAPPLGPRQRTVRH